jgi:hypothetical protein
MGQLNRQVLGRVSGKIGDIVFRQRAGKNFASVKPDSINVSDDPASIDRRNRFALACKFSSHINAVPYLSPIWKKKTPAGLSAYNYITKINYMFTEPDELSDLASLVPGLGFGVTVNSSALIPPNLNVVIDPIGSISGIDTAAEPVMRLCTIISLTNPNDEYIDRAEFITLVSGDQAAVLDAPLTFQVPYSSQETQLFNSYQDKKAFSVLVSLDQDENPVHYSNTILL